jgi:hypothetical protein
MSPAVRARKNAEVRRCRARKREGKVRLSVTVTEAHLLGVLRISGWLGPDDRDPERRQLEELLQTVVDTWITPPAE